MSIKRKTTHALYGELLMLRSPNIFEIEKLPTSCESIKLIAVTEWVTDTAKYMVCVAWLRLCDRVSVWMFVCVCVCLWWSDKIGFQLWKMHLVVVVIVIEHNNYTYWILARTTTLLTKWTLTHTIAHVKYNEMTAIGRCFWALAAQILTSTSNVPKRFRCYFYK